jgi:ring-1,2-phenylacetyl-CoA epoxidase subunit PaaE
MIQFHPLKVKAITKETAECVSVLFDVPANLRETFKFTHGQYLTFKRTLEGVEVRRSYSICSSPLDNELRVAIKKIDGGVFSSWANDVLKVGESLETMPPQGRFFTAVDKKAQKNYLLIAAGSGITPILSIAKTMLQTEPQSHVTLIYGNKNKASIIFKSELEALKNRHLERLSLYHVLSRERAEADFLTGRIDGKKIEYFLDKIMPAKTISESFLCGPEEMILGVKDVLAKAGVPEANIHFELFFSSIAKAKKAQAQTAEQDEGEKSIVTLKLDGVETVFKLGQQGENILDAALKNGVDLPFACKGGVCATCRAKVEVGSVEMDVNYSLAPDELKAGYVLTCQAHPRTKEVRVNFDIK